MLLCASVLQVKAQDVASNPVVPNPVVYESVSFSNQQGSITIDCDEKEALTDFELIGQDVHFAFSWDEQKPADRFPMKLHLKPGEVTLKYRMQGEKSNFMKLKLLSGEHLKLQLKKARTARGNTST
jgi:hypothetical protein